MKAIMRILWFGSIISCTLACHKMTSTPGMEHQLLNKVKNLEDVVFTQANGDSLITAWRKFLELPLLKKDSALLGIVNYNLARLYGMRGHDSAKVFIERAFETVEPTVGNEKYKALIYNGLGNIRSMAAKQREASYYYNKAAAIVMADTTAALSSEAKTAILLSAAQSNRTFFQYKLAENMNRAALILIDSLPKDHINRQRALVQTIHILSLQHKPASSMTPYIRKLEILQASHPDKYDISFLYESKVKFFERMKQLDSVLHYLQIKTQADELLYRKHLSSVNVDNLLVDYCDEATIYTQLKQPVQAAHFLEKARKLKHRHAKLIFDDEEILYENSVAELYSIQGRKDSAIKVLKHVAELKDALYQTEQSQAIAEMNALYLLQVKDRSIHSLNEGIKIKQLQLQQNRLWLVVSVLGVVLLGVTLSFVYYSFRQRKSTQDKEKILLQHRLLQTQMEPHFIFNTLSAVQSFIRLSEKDKAIKYLNCFSRLLRSTLEFSREDKIPLSEEIDALDNYLSLQQMRFEGAFTYAIELPNDQDLGAIELPPMLIQPFVENAIVHGIEMASGTGKVCISFHVDSNILKVIVSDTGNNRRQLSTTPHLSLSGIISRERIKLLGKNASIEEIRCSENGTIVTLNIPGVYN
ncbi:histidine kinase [uncultured Mucilaginibacter sp.]|uniref:histidine kinase n=1 Tax=uncultured Mucilaginibacter sp. TaxID=797541 RepID=UPI0025D4099E|nr:histidine kinase [uncultured Mucilaginibacter sp.]